MRRTILLCLLAFPLVACGGAPVDSAPPSPAEVYDSSPTSLAEQPPGVLVNVSLFFVDSEPPPGLILTVESLGFVFDLDSSGAHISTSGAASATSTAVSDASAAVSGASVDASGVASTEASTLVSAVSPTSADVSVDGTTVSSSSPHAVKAPASAARAHHTPGLQRSSGSPSPEPA